MERLESGRIAMTVYVGEYASSRSVGGAQKRWNETVKDCLRKRGLDVRQVRRMGQDRSKCRGFLRGNPWGAVRG